MAAMRAVGKGHQPPAHADVREDACEYVVRLVVSDFIESELIVGGLRAGADGAGRSGVEVAEDDGKAFRLHERLEETFRLPAATP